MRVLLADDHAVVRRGTREILLEVFPDAQFEEAATGEEAVAAVARQPLDLVILDIGMPGRGGIDALKEIQARQPQLPVLVVSHHAEEQYAVRAFRAGARGYLMKESAPEELAHAAKRILEGGKYVSSALAERLADLLGQDATKPLHDALSDRELQVLQLLGTGKTVKEIAFELSLSDKTISTYRARILLKTKMKSNAELMRYALRVGLVE